MLPVLLAHHSPYLMEKKEWTKVDLVFVELLSYGRVWDGLQLQLLFRSRRIVGHNSRRLNGHRIGMAC